MAQHRFLFIKPSVWRSLCSEANQEPQRPLHRTVQNTLREDGPYRERRRGHKDGGLCGLQIGSNISSSEPNVDVTGFWRTEQHCSHFFTGVSETKPLLAA